MNSTRLVSNGQATRRTSLLRLGPHRSSTYYSMIGKVEAARRPKCRGIRRSPTTAGRVGLRFWPAAARRAADGESSQLLEILVAQSTLTAPSGNSFRKFIDIPPPPGSEPASGARSAARIGCDRFSGRMPVDPTITIPHAVTAARRGSMKIKTLLPILLVLAATLPTSTARSQDAADAMLVRMVSWFTGDPAVLFAPSCSDPVGPTNYAEDTCCADGNCGCCSQCCHRYDTWGSVEFLMWWAKGTSLPPLVTTSPAGTPQAQAGVLGFPGTSTLFGDQLGGNKLQGGGRVTAGIWLDPDHNVAVGGRFFGLGGDTSRFNQASGGNPILAIPFFNASPLINREDSLLLAYPGLSSGRVNAFLTTNNIIGAEAFTEIMMTRDQSTPHRPGGRLSVLPPRRLAADQQQQHAHASG